MHSCFTEDEFIDEVMLSSDMGLYYDFTVDKNTGRVSGYGDKRLKENEGKDRPVSCPGLTGRLPQIWRLSLVADRMYTNTKGSVVQSRSCAF